MKRLIPLLVLLLILPLLALAQGTKQEDQNAVHSITVPDVPADLKDGPGKQLVEQYCGICHTPGYIPMQPLFPKDKWDGIVHKMIKVYGAPVPEDVAQKIIDYLGTHYSPPGSAG